MSDRTIETEFRFAPIPEVLLYDTTVTPLAVRVYGALMRHGLGPDSCFPKQQRIADLLGVSKQAVYTALRLLESRGWIERRTRYLDGGSQTSNGYLLKESAAPPTSDEGAETRGKSAAPPTSDEGGPLREMRGLEEREQLNERTTLFCSSDDERDGDGPTKRKRQRRTFTADFDAWWEHYPRKVGKDAARKRYDKVRRDGATAEQLVDGVGLYERGEWRGRDLDHVPYPATWLNAFDPSELTDHQTNGNAPDTAHVCETVPGRPSCLYCDAPMTPPTVDEFNAKVTA